MGLPLFLRRLFPGARSKQEKLTSATESSSEVSKGWQATEQPDLQDAALFQIPGAFPSSPPRTPRLAPTEHVKHYEPPTRPSREAEKTAELDRMDVDIPFMPELRTELGSYLRPQRSQRLSIPSTPVQKKPRPIETPKRTDETHPDAMQIDDPWAARSMMFEMLPFGAPVSAVQLVSPQRTPIPNNRIASIYQKEWDQREQEKQAWDAEQGRAIRIRPQGKCVRQLSVSWLDRVTKAMHSHGAVAQSLSGDELYQKDIATCIKPLAWLNDEIINSYLAVIIQYLRNSTGNTPDQRPRYHAFNSFFYSSLRDKGYDSVRRWAKRAKIGGEVLLEVDTVFVPVHESSHWTLMVVRPMDRTIEYFDSLGGRGARQVDTIRKWLHGELGNKFVADEWTLLPSVSSYQDNGSDCGVFLLTNAKAIALNIEPTAFGAKDTILLRRKIVAEIMNGGLHGEFSPVDKTGTVLL
ncbi:uncharacterized protein N7483_010689 [Penicillium malachiteum]|uniref:uncharacterized protein n=1 Tax=Penicillium malachiteum TaxID=1324776 RepID=UPI002548A1AA|nr:uncharacterized protein N7483_010689 [Penicillium malachiteum]KAJ5713508.1 hypothetical protein N7483_010689 [Penicillium malachiteum]